MLCTTLSALQVSPFKTRKYSNKVVIFEFPFHENKAPQGQGILSAVFTAVHPVPQCWQQETAI